MVHSQVSESPDLSDPASLRLIQNTIGWNGRESVARELAARGGSFGGTPENGGDPRRLRQLREKGCCSAPVHPALSECAAVTDYFANTLCYAAHVPAQSDGVARSVDETAARANYGSYTLEQSLRAPRVTELALDPAVLALASGYLGCAPSLYSINTFWTFPRPDEGLTHHYHRDEDDFRFLVLFVYWTDVGVGEGEFYFIEGTHDYRTVERRIRLSPWPFIHKLRKRHTAHSAEELRRLNGGTGYGHDGLYRRLFGRHVRRIDGGAGTAILSDTFGLHCGALPHSRRRLCTWIRYGLYENTTYRNDQTIPVPASAVRGRVRDDVLTRHVTRLLLDWNC
jgi:hypothetical protein